MTGSAPQGKRANTASGATDRWQSSAMHSLVFASLCGALLFVALNSPLYSLWNIGVFFVLFGSPLATVALFFPRGDVGIETGDWIVITNVAGYAIAGILVGYKWPINTLSMGRAVASIGRRFFLTLFVFCMGGAITGTWVVANYAS